MVLFSTGGDDCGAILHCLLQVMEDTMWSSPECGSAEDCYTDEAELAKFPKQVGNKSKNSSSSKGTANILFSNFEAQSLRRPVVC